MPKNILMILLDQLRFDCLGFKGIYDIKTPNIDRLAAKGTVFSEAYTPLPSCCPARQAILTGKTPERIGALWNYDSCLPVYSLNKTDFTYSMALKDAGYNLGYIGKWHDSEKYRPGDFGFDRVVLDGYYQKYRQETVPDKPFQKVDWFRAWDGKKDDINVEHSRTHWQADEANRIIDDFEREGKPWHVRLEFNEPHLPCTPSEPFASIYDPKAIKPWGGFYDGLKDKPYMQGQQRRVWDVEGMSWEDWAEKVAMYFGIITQTDDAIGKVLDNLGKKGILEETVIVLTSDHGDMCGSHGMPDKHYNLYDDIVRIPLIITGFGKGTDSNYVYNMDLCPTFLEIAGVKTDEQFDAISLLPNLKGKPEKNREYAVSTFNGMSFGLYTLRMLKDKKYKYIYNTADVDELYDMESDPYELKNLSLDESYKELIRERRRLLYHELKKSGDRLIANPWIENQLIGRKENV